MRFKIRVKTIWMLCLFGFLGTSALWLAAQDRGDPVNPPRFTGTVNYEVRPQVTRARLIVSVWKNNSFVGGLNVKLINTPALMSGNAYKCLIEPFSTQPGYPVTVSFLSETSPVKKPLLATAHIEQPPVIKSPVLDSQIDLDSSQPLIIKWSGGTPPYSITVVELIGDATPSVFGPANHEAGIEVLLWPARVRRTAWSRPRLKPIRRVVTRRLFVMRSL